MRYWVRIDRLLVEVPFRLTNFVCYRMQKQVTVMLLPTVRLQWLKSIGLYAVHVTPFTTKQLRVSTLAPSALPRPLVPKFSRGILIHATGHILVTSVTKTVWQWEWEQDGLWVEKSVKKLQFPCDQILSLSFSIYSAISVTISSHQSVFATSFRSRLASFHTDLCMFYIYIYIYIYI